MSGGTVNLYVMGNNTPIASATTASNGGFSLNYTSPGGTNVLYLLVTGGNAGGGTNSKLTLGSILGSAGNLPSSVTINEMTTTALSNIGLVYGVESDSNGTVTFSAPKNAAAVTNIMNQWNNIIANGKVNTGNSNLASGSQNALSTVANALASCVETPGNCSTLFNTSSNGSGGASLNMLDAIVNMETVSTNLTPYNLASPLAPTTGFSISSTPTVLNAPMPVAVSTLVSGSVADEDPDAIAFDSQGNVWITNYDHAALGKLSSSGSVLGDFSVGGAKGEGLAIDAGNNIWISNYVGNSVVQVNSAGTTVGTFNVGGTTSSIAIDPAGDIWVGGSGAGLVELNASGTILRTLSSVPAGIIAIDASNNLWITNSNSSIAKIGPSGVVIGNATSTGTSRGMAIDVSGNVLTENSDGTINKFNSSGTLISTFSGTGSVTVILDASGNIWTANGTQLAELNPSGSVIATYTVVSGSQGIGIDSSGNVWTLQNTHTNSISKVPGVATGPTFFPYSGPMYPWSQGF